MIKAIVGVIAGYFLMAVVIGILCLAGFVTLGPDRFFQADSYQVSTLWMGISLVISISSSVLGGHVCAVIGKSIGACKVLALIVLVFGLIFCFNKIREDTNWRAGDVP